MKMSFTENNLLKYLIFENCPSQFLTNYWLRWTTRDISERWIWQEVANWHSSIKSQPTMFRLIFINKLCSTSYSARNFKLLIIPNHCYCVFVTIFCKNFWTKWLGVSCKPTVRSFNFFITAISDLYISFRNAVFEFNCTHV